MKLSTYWNGGVDLGGEGGKYQNTMFAVLKHNKLLLISKNKVMFAEK